MWATLAAGSLWLVAIATGIGPPHAHERYDLVAGAWADDSDRSFIGRELRRGHLFSSAAFDSWPHTDAPAILSPFVGNQWQFYNFWWFPREPDAFLRFQLFSDKALTKPADPLRGNGTLLLIFESDRPVANIESDGKITYSRGHLGERGEFVTGPSPKNTGDHWFYYQVVVEPAKVGVKGPPLTGPETYEKPGSYLMRITYQERLVSAKGISDFEWSQHFVTSETQWPSRVATTVLVDSGYVDIRLLQSSTPGPLASVHRSSNFGGATVIEDIRDVEANDPNPTKAAEVSVYGVSPGRKSLLDFIVFTMAAVFGAAVASVSEICTSWLRLRKR